MKLFLLIAFTSSFFAQTIDDIVDDFSSYDGQTVTITGVLLNDFGNIRTDRTSVYIVSSSGKALNVSSSTDYTSLMRGQRVSITGTISEFSDVYQIDPASAPTVLESNVAIPDPISARTGDIAPIVYHGDYVEIQGIIKDLYSTGSTGSNIEVDDGTGVAAVRVWTTTGMTISYLEDSLALSIGDAVTIRGGTGTFSGAGQIVPSVRSDIQKGQAGDDLHPTREIYISAKAQVFNIQSNEPIEFNLKAPAEAQVRLTIYDFNGRKMKSFDYFAAIGTSELRRWDKLSDDFQKPRIGTYILQMEVVEVNGRRTVKRLPLVLGARL